MRLSAERSKLSKDANAVLSTEGEHRRRWCTRGALKEALADRERLIIIIIIIIIFKFHPR